MNIIQVPAHTNNYSVGRKGKTIKYVIMHWIVGTLKSADATFANPNRGASAHYGVGPKEIHQYVAEKDTAWHANNGPMNLESVGIEHEGGPKIAISDETYENSAKLLLDICTRNSIPLNRDRIKGHKEVGDNPTACPGALDIDRIISRAIALKEGDMPKTVVEVPDADFKKLVRNSTNWEAAAKALSLDPNAEKEGEKVKARVEEIEKQAQAKVAEQEKKTKEAVETLDNVSKELSDLKTTHSELVDDFAELQADYHELSTKEPETVTVTKYVQPTTFGELWTVIIGFFKRLGNKEVAEGGENNGETVTRNK